MKQAGGFRMIDFEQRARVQIVSEHLPPARDAALDFVISLADAIRFVVSQPAHEQERLEILVAESDGTPGRVLNAGEIGELYAAEDFPPPLPFG
jgi:hypothetical protein